MRRPATRTEFVLTAVRIGLLVAVWWPWRLTAQETWFTGLYFESDFFQGDSPAWEDWRTIRGVAVRQFEGGAVGVEVDRVERFGLADATVAIDVYANLWTGSYANLRTRIGPDPQIVPASDWRLEVFQAFSEGWEGSGNLRRSTVPGPNVVVAGLGLAKYLNAWYLRGLGSVAEVGGSRSGGAAFFARRFLEDDGRQFIEVGGGLGGESVTVGPGPSVDVRDTSFFQVTLQRTVLSPFGVSATLGVNDFEGVPLRRHITLGATARF